MSTDTAALLKEFNRLRDTKYQNLAQQKALQVEQAAAQKRTEVSGNIPQSWDDFNKLFPNATSEEAAAWKSQREDQLYREMRDNFRNSNSRDTMDISNDFTAAVAKSFLVDLPKMGYGLANVASSLHPLNQLRKAAIDAGNILGLPEDKQPDGLIDQFRQLITKSGKAVENSSAVNAIPESLDEVVHAAGIKPEVAFEEGDKFFNSFKSQGAKSSERDIQIERELFELNKPKRIAQRMAEGDSEGIAKFKDMFSAAAQGASSYIRRPLEVANAVGESASSFVGAAGLGKLVTSNVLKTAANTVAGKKIAEEAAKIASERAAVGFVAATEGASNAEDVRAEILKLSSDQLKDIPGYTELENKIGPQLAKVRIANEAAEDTFALAATIGAITNKVSGAGKVEGNFFNKFTEGKDSIINNALNLLNNTVGASVREMVEEGSQGAGGAFARNVGLTTVDPNRDLTQDVGYEAGQGAVVGFASIPVNKFAIANVTGAVGAVKGAIALPEKINQFKEQLKTAKASADKIFGIKSVTSSTEAVNKPDAVISEYEKHASTLNNKAIIDITPETPVADKISILLNANNIPADAEGKQQRYQELKAGFTDLQTELSELNIQIQNTPETEKAKLKELQKEFAVKSVVTKHLYNKILHFHGSLKQNATTEAPVEASTPTVEPTPSEGLTDTVNGPVEAPRAPVEKEPEPTLEEIQQAQTPEETESIYKRLLGSESEAEDTSGKYSLPDDFVTSTPKPTSTAPVQNVESNTLEIPEQFLNTSQEEETAEEVSQYTQEQLDAADTNRGTIGKINAVLSHPYMKLTDEQRTALQERKILLEAFYALRKETKTVFSEFDTDEVHNLVMNGDETKGYLGIRDYVAGIRKAVDTNNKDSALSLLNSLALFANKHVLKAIRGNYEKGEDGKIYKITPKSSFGKVSETERKREEINKNVAIEADALVKTYNSLSEMFTKKFGERHIPAHIKNLTASIQENFAGMQAATVKPADTAKAKLQELSSKIIEERAHYLKLNQKDREKPELLNAFISRITSLESDYKNVLKENPNVKEDRPLNTNETDIVTAIKTKLVNDYVTALNNKKSTDPKVQKKAIKQLEILDNLIPKYSFGSEIGIKVREQLKNIQEGKTSNTEVTSSITPTSDNTSTTPTVTPVKNNWITQYKNMQTREGISRQKALAALQSSLDRDLNATDRTVAKAQTIVDFIESNGYTDISLDKIKANIAEVNDRTAGKSAPANQPEVNKWVNNFMSAKEGSQQLANFQNIFTYSKSINEETRKAVKAKLTTELGNSNITVPVAKVAKAKDITTPSTPVAKPPVKTGITAERQAKIREAMAAVLDSNTKTSNEDIAKVINGFQNFEEKKFAKSIWDESKSSKGKESKSVSNDAITKWVNLFKRVKNNPGSKSNENIQNSFRALTDKTLKTEVIEALKAENIDDSVFGTEDTSTPTTPVSKKELTAEEVIATAKRIYDYHKAGNKTEAAKELKALQGIPNSYKKVVSEFEELKKIKTLDTVETVNTVVTTRINELLESLDETKFSIHLKELIAGDNQSGLLKELTQEAIRQGKEPESTTLKIVIDKLGLKEPSADSAIGKILTYVKENIFKFFNYKPNSKNILHRLPTVMHDEVQYKALYDQLSPAQQIGLTSFKEFHDKFKEELYSSVGLSTWGELPFRHKRMFEYLFSENLLKFLEANKDIEADESQNLSKHSVLLNKAIAENIEILNSAVITAMALSAHNFLTNSGRDTLFNSFEKIRRMFGMDKEAQIEPHLQQTFTEMGLLRTGVRESIGKELLSIIGLSKNKNAPLGQVNGLAPVAGAIVLNTLQGMGLIYETEISNTLIEELTGKSDSRYAKEKQTKNDRTIEVVTQGIKVTQDEEGNLSKDITDYIELSRASRGLFKEIFGVPDLKINPSFKPLAKVASNKKIDKSQEEDFYDEELELDSISMKNSIQDVPEKVYQAVNRMQGYENKLNATFVQFFRKLSNLTQETVIGVVSEEDILKEHISKRRGIRGANLTLRYELEDAKEFFNLVEQQKEGFNTSFYYPVIAVKSGRLHIDTNTFNPQRSKVHRFFGHIKSFEQTVDSERKRDMFLVAVALSFGAKIDVLYLDKIKEEGLSIIADEVVQKAVTAIKAIESNDNLSEKQRTAYEQDIIKAVKKGKEKNHTLLALHALTVYSPNKPFKTSLGIEVDGKTNGPAIALLQYLGAVDSQEFAHKAAKVGIFVDNSPYKQYADFHADGNLDNYKQLAVDINAIQREVEESGNAEDFRYSVIPKYLIERYLRTNAETREELFKLIGQFSTTENNETVVSKEIRDIHKPPVMTVIYGIGTSKVVSNYDYNWLELIYKRGMSQDEATKQQVIQLLSKILEKDNFTNRKVLETNPSEFLLSPADQGIVEEFLKDTYGALLEMAYASHFNTFLRSRDIINHSVQTMYSVFDTLYQYEQERVLNKKIEEAFNALPAVDQTDKHRNSIRANMSLSANELREIQLSLRGVMPIFPGPLSTEDRATWVAPFKEKGAIKADPTDYAFKQSIRFGSYTNKKGVYKSTENDLMAKKPLIKEPVVAGGPLSVQHIDSAVMQGVLNQFDVLNIFDAIYVSIADVEKATTAMNKSFMDIMQNYSIREAVQYSLSQLKENTREYIRSIGLNNEETVALMQQITANFARLNLNSREGKYGKTEHRTVDGFITYATDKYNQDKRLIDEQIASIERVAQFPFIDTAYEVEGKTVSPIEESFNNDAISDEEVAADIARLLNSQAGSTIRINQFSNVTPSQLHAGDIQTTYEVLKNNGPVQDSQDHQDYLSELSRYLGSYLNRPISLYTQTLGTRTEGLTDLQNIYINEGSRINSNLDLSVGETYVHEVTHTIVGEALDKDSEVTREVRRLHALALEGIQRIASQRGIQPAMLLVGPNPTLADVQAAQIRYNSLFEAVNSKRQTRTVPGTSLQVTELTSPYLQEFFAMGVTNAAMIKLLDQISAEESKPRTIREKLIHLYQKILNKFFNVPMPKNTIHQSLRNLIPRLAAVQAFHATRAEKVLNRVDTGINNVINNWVVRPFHTLIAGGTPNPNTPVSTTLMNALRKVLMRQGLSEEGFILATLREIAPSTDIQKRYENLHRLSINYIDQLRLSVSTEIQKQLLKRFNSNLSNMEKSFITSSIIRSDASNLLDKGYTADQIRNLIADPAARSAEITHIKQLIRNGGFGDKNSNYYILQAFELAKLTQESTTNVTGVMRNAHTIANLTILKSLPANVVARENLRIQGDVNRAEELVDILSTLASMQYAYGQAEVANIWNQNPEAMTFLLEAHREFKKSSLQNLFKNNKMLMRKGYVKEEFSPYVDFIVAEAVQEEELKKQGYTKRGAVRIDPDFGGGPTELYIYTSRVARIPRVRGQVSLTSRTHAGTDIHTVAYQHNNTMITPQKKDLINPIMTKAIVDQFRGISNPVGNKYNRLIPVFDEYGKVSNLTYNMPKDIRIRLLGMQDNFDFAMGDMFASINDKINTVNFNNEMARLIHEDYVTNYASHPEEFKLMSKLSEDYKLIPAEMQYKLERLFGTSDTIPIRTSVYNLVFGYKEFSVTNLQYDNTMAGKTYRAVLHAAGVLSNGKINPALIKQMEDVWKEIVGVAKNFIVIRSIDVLAFNIISNVFLTWAKGVPLKEIIAHHAQANKLIDEYFEQMDERTSLRLNIRIDPNNRALQVKLNRVEETIARNPVKELVDAGMFQSIVEDVDMLNMPEKYPTYLESFFAPLERKLPNGVKKVVDIAILREHTKQHQFLKRLTQKSDFVARYTLHKYNMSRKKMSREASYEDVVKTFVNYDTPSHTGWDYANKMGLMMFTKYWLRIQQIIMEMFHTKPSRMLLLGFGQEMLGEIATFDDSSFFSQGLGSHMKNPADVIGGLFTAAPVDLASDVIF